MGFKEFQGTEFQGTDTNLFESRVCPLNSQRGVTDDEVAMWNSRPPHIDNVVDVFIVTSLSDGSQACAFYASWAKARRRSLVAGAGINCIFLGEQSGKTLAHELGHILLNGGHAGEKWDLMHDRHSLSAEELRYSTRIQRSWLGSIANQTAIFRASALNLPK